jgi:hypothetical protein
MVDSTQLMPRGRAAAGKEAETGKAETKLRKDDKNSLRNGGKDGRTQQKSGGLAGKRAPILNLF